MRMIVVVGWFVLVAGCKEKKCTSEITNATPSGVSYRWSECSDGADRTLACDLKADKFVCACTRDGKPGPTFEVASTGTIKSDLVTPEMAKEKCGWDFVP